MTHVTKECVTHVTLLFLEIHLLNCIIFKNIGTVLLAGLLQKPNNAFGNFVGNTS